MDFYNNPSSPFTPSEKIQRFTEIYNQLNISLYTQQRINNLYSLAKHELTKLTVNSKMQVELIKFCDLLMQRES